MRTCPVNKASAAGSIFPAVSLPDDRAGSFFGLTKAAPVLINILLMKTIPVSLHTCMKACRDTGIFFYN
ncbi:MAG: hypothetical protein D3903_20880 [Candidatus Electrothrix sp. GM3_4]|nr:hypothetical protein [Candidatus Electrothrix sp. GM3_4]